MRHRSALLLWLLLGSAYGQKIDGPLTVVLTADGPVQEAVLQPMQRETEAAVKASGIQLAWRTEPSAVAQEVFSRLAIVRLRGACTAAPAVPVTSAPSLSTPSHPLGQTQVVEGKVLPFADLQCDAVRRVIARELRVHPEASAAEVLGRALGRVLAHELYHIVLKTQLHGKTGLARPLISSADLVAVRYEFAPQDEQRLSQEGEEEESGARR